MHCGGQTHALWWTDTCTVVDRHMHCGGQTHALWWTDTCTVVDRHMHCGGQTHALWWTDTCTVVDRHMHCGGQTHALWWTDTCTVVDRHLYINQGRDQVTIERAVDLISVLARCVYAAIIIRQARCKSLGSLASRALQNSHILLSTCSNAAGIRHAASALVTGTALVCSIFHH